MQRESKMKGLEEEITKMKKSKELMEK